MGSTSEVTKKVVNMGERQNQKTIETSGYSMALFHFVDWGHQLPEILAGIKYNGCSWWIYLGP